MISSPHIETCPYTELPSMIVNVNQRRGKPGNEAKLSTQLYLLLKIKNIFYHRLSVIMITWIVATQVYSYPNKAVFTCVCRIYSIARSFPMSCAMCNTKPCMVDKYVVALVPVSFDRLDPCFLKAKRACMGPGEARRIYSSFGQGFSTPNKIFAYMHDESNACLEKSNTYNFSLFSN